MIDWGERYGATFTVRDVTGTTVVTGDQELIKEIFSADPELFANVPETFDVIFGPNSLAFKMGAEHLLMRKLMAPRFIRGCSLNSLTPAGLRARSFPTSRPCLRRPCACAPPAPKTSAACSCPGASAPGSSPLG